jgi:hypothetical protein
MLNDKGWSEKPILAESIQEALALLIQKSLVAIELRKRRLLGRSVKVSLSKQV